MECSVAPAAAAGESMRSRVILLVFSLCIWAALPAFLPRNLTDLLAFAGIYTIAGLGVGLLLGHCGIVNLAQAVFYGIGAYSTAYLTTELGAPSIVGFVVGAVLSMTVALVIGWPVLRLTGHFLALATLALSIIGSALFFEWDGITGGTLGIGGIPKLHLFGLAIDTPARSYYVIWIVAFVCMLLARNLATSRTGLMFRAMRDSTDAAISLAINLQWLRTRAFVLSALFGSVAGSLFAHYTSFVSVESFTMSKSFSFLVITVIGGVQSVFGAVIGALFITFLPEYLSRLGDFHQVLFGLAVVGVVVGLQGGIVGALEMIWRKLTKPGAA
jgi:ABC-type branched-subunit amino acid transport system permease subunit